MGKRGIALLLLGALLLAGCSRTSLSQGFYTTGDRRWQLEIRGEQEDPQLILTLPSGMEKRFWVEENWLIPVKGF